MSRAALNPEQKAAVLRDYPTQGARAVAERLGVPKHMVKNYVHKAKLKKDASHLLHAPFTDAQRAVIQEKFADHRTELVAQEIGRTVQSVRAYAAKHGLKKSAAFMASEASGRLRPGNRKGAANRFRKGITPPNKGKKVPEHIKRKSAQTWFQKGQLPHNTKADGHVSVRRDADGREYYWIRLALGKWKHLHRHLWEQAHGAVPDGHVVTFKDGNQKHCVLENLECITEAERLARTCVHNLPEELKRTVQAKGVLKRMINKRTKDHEQQEAHQ